MEKKKRLVLAIDPGGSATKVIIHLDGHCSFLTMPPEMIKLPHQVIQGYDMSSTGFKVSARNSAWIQMRGDNECYVVGEWARRLLASNQLQLLKHETILPKALAAIGCVAQENQLDQSDLDLVMVLPYSEFEHKAHLEKDLRQALKGLVFRGKKWHLKVQTFRCLPEGGGLYFWQVARKGEGWIAGHAFNVVMIGHRNVSYFRFDRGSLASGITGDLGINHLIQRVLSRNTGHTEEQILPLLCSEQDLLPTTSVVQTALRSEQPENRAREAEALITAIKSAKVEYWQSLQQWLNKVEGTSPSHEIILAGGGAYLPFMRQLLSQRYLHRNVNWCHELHQEIAQTFGLEYLTTAPSSPNSAMAIRLADPYALLSWTIHQLEAA